VHLALHPRRRRLHYGFLQHPGARALRHRGAVAVALDPVAVAARPLLRRRTRASARAPIESAARMAHSAAPTQKLRGNEWRAVGTLLPYVLEYRWRVLLALACLITAKLANVAVPL